MKIASLDCNNVKSHLPNLLQWLKRAKPDIVCLQELKSTDAEFPQKEILKAGYPVVWRDQKTGNAVAILSKGTEPILTRNVLPDDKSVDQPHYWRNSFGRNAGLRIDHLLISPVLAKRPTDAGVGRDVRGRPHPSDHAPVWITLSDASPPSRKAR